MAYKSKESAASMYGIVNATGNLLTKDHEIRIGGYMYRYDAETGTFWEFDEEFEVTLKISIDYAIAAHLWEKAVEDEEYVHSYISMAIAIFGDFDNWQSLVFLKKFIDFSGDIEYLKEASR